jgi:hypothetical protein
MVRNIFAEIFTKYKDVNPRKKTSVYNTLGVTFLSLHDKQQDLTEFRTEVREALAESLVVEPTVGNLLFIKAIFRMALPIDESDPPEYTNAETYEGLCKVYKKLLKLENLLGIEYDYYCDCLVNCQNKRDVMNRKLNRNK